MSSDDRIRKKRSFRNPMLIVGFVMTIFYFVLGALATCWTKLFARNTR